MASRDPDGRYVARAELALARDDIWPLRQVPLRPDPLTSFAHTFAGLRGDLHEEAVVALDLVPLTRGQQQRRRRRLVRTLTGSGSRLQQIAGQFAAELAGKPRDRGRVAAPSGVAALDQRDRDRTLAGALRDTHPHFQLQVLMRVRSDVEGRPEAHLQGLIACFETFAGDNYFRVVGRRIGPWFVGADVAWRRRAFDRRLDAHRWRPARNRVVAAGEIAGLLKPPTLHCTAPNVVRSGGVVPPPPRTLPAFQGRADQLPWGVVSHDDDQRTVAAWLDETFFTALFGRSRFGKTETALTRFVHVARTGHGCVFLDPHADALSRAKPYLTEVGDRVIELSIARGSAGSRQVGWNPFSMAGRTPEDVEDRAAAIVDSFAAAMRWGEINNRALSITQMTTQSLLELALALPDELAPTIFQMPTLLSDPDWRDAVVCHLSPSLRDYWTNRFPRLATEAITPITNVVDRLRSAPSITALLGQSRSTYSLRHAMDAGQIVLIRLRGTSQIDQLIASFVVYDLLAATLSRWDLPPHRRRPMHAFLDEVQSYDHSVRGLLASALEEGGKFGLRLHLTNQQPTRLSPQTLQAVLTNRSHLASTSVGYDSARLLAREWGGQVAPETIMALDKYQFVSQVTMRGQLTSPFRMGGLSLEQTFGPPADPGQVADLEARIDRNSGRRPVTDVLDELATLDRRIVDHLAEASRIVPLASRQPPSGATTAVRSPWQPGQVRRFGYSGGQEED